jgi:mannose PTS system EIIA component
MVGLVVAAHGRLAQELVATAEQIMGAMPEVATVSIEPGTSPEDIRAQMRAAVKELDHGEGVLVLADLFGGTPCKESLLLCQKANVEVLAGVNLPMLMKAASLRKEHLPLQAPLSHRDFLPSHRQPAHPRTGGRGLASGAEGGAGRGRG